MPKNRDYDPIILSKKDHGKYSGKLSVYNMMLNSTEKHIPIYSFKTFIKMVNYKCIVTSIMGEGK